MDAATIAALSGAPPFVVLAIVIIYLLRDHRKERREFIVAIAQMRTSVSRQSAILLIVCETLAPNRGKIISERVQKLYEMEAQGGNNDPFTTYLSEQEK